MWHDFVELQWNPGFGWDVSVQESPSGMQLDTHAAPCCVMRQSCSALRLIGYFTFRAV